MANGVSARTGSARGDDAFVACIRPKTGRFFRRNVIDPERNDLEIILGGDLAVPELADVHYRQFSRPAFRP